MLEPQLEVASLHAFAAFVDPQRDGHDVAASLPWPLSVGHISITDVGIGGHAAVALEVVASEVVPGSVLADLADHHDRDSVRAAWLSGRLLNLRKHVESIAISGRALSHRAVRVHLLEQIENDHDVLCVAGPHQLAAISQDAAEGEAASEPASGCCHPAKPLRRRSHARSPGGAAGYLGEGADRLA